MPRNQRVLMIAIRRFPKFAAVLTAPSDGRPRTMDESFDFGLQRVLDGIDLYIKSATAARPS